MPDQRGAALLMVLAVVLVVAGALGLLGEAVGAVVLVGSDLAARVGQAEVVGPIVSGMKVSSASPR